jgi:hypothetical protein
MVALMTYVNQQQATREQNQRLARESEEARKREAIARQDEYNKEATARREEYERRLWERQLDLYLQACKATSTLASVESPKDSEFVSARMRFQQLYYGELCVVESRPVSDSMIAFRDALLAYETDPSAGKRGELRRIALRLAQACRDSTESVYKVNFGDVDLNEKINSNR